MGKLAGFTEKEAKIVADIRGVDVNSLPHSSGTKKRPYYFRASEEEIFSARNGLSKAEEPHREQNDILNRLSQIYTEDELRRLSEGRGLGRPETERSSNISGIIGHHKIGVISDTHIGSSYTNPDDVIESIKLFEKEKCELILHCGDISEGISRRPGHVFECSQWGFDAQFKECVRLFSISNIPIYGITGNHDAWAVQNVGVDMGEYLSNSIPNFNYLGNDYCTIDVGSAKVMLWHGNDGSSYASSYRVQKIIESLQGGTKPNILICGHTHKFIYLFERNIHALSAGCVQRQTSFMRGKKLSAHTGKTIIEFDECNGEVINFQVKFYPIY